MPIERTQPFASRISWGVAICLTLTGLFIVGCERPATEATNATSPTGAPDMAAVGVVFSADPNPVPPGNPKGRTTITWDTGSDAIGEVYVVGAGNEQLFASGRQGSQEAPWIQPGRSEFRLYEQSDHKLIGRLTVTMIGADAAGNKPSPTKSP
jgi:hypothetical protein